MYARSTTFQAKASSIDAGIGLIRDEVHARGAGHVRLHGTVHDGRPPVRPMHRDQRLGIAGPDARQRRRDRPRSANGPARCSAARHSPRNGRSPSCTGTTTPIRAPVSGPPGPMATRRDRPGNRHLPDGHHAGAWRTCEGFCSASMFVDRMDGRAVTSVTYDSRQAMDSSRDAAMTLRRTTARDTGVDILDVAEFDLLVAHLRVPEMA